MTVTCYIVRKLFVSIPWRNRKSFFFCLMPQQMQKRGLLRFEFGTNKMWLFDVVLLTIWWLVNITCSFYIRFIVCAYVSVNLYQSPIKFGYYKRTYRMIKVKYSPYFGKTLYPYWTPSFVNVFLLPPAMSLHILYHALKERQLTSFRRCASMSTC